MGHLRARRPVARARSERSWSPRSLRVGTRRAAAARRHCAPRPPRPARGVLAVYGRFADAWRVTDATTLFDYDAGKSTASYRIADYPAAPKVARLQELDPGKAAAGREACTAVEDARLRDECAFDVAVTGDHGYVGPYVLTQHVAQQGSAALDLPIPSPTASPQASGPAANPPVEVLPLIHRLAGSALAPDGTLYVSAVMAQRSGRLLAIDPLTGAVLRQAETTGAGEVAVAAGSVWVGDFTAPSTGPPPCSITRLDMKTLVVQATIPSVCHLGATELAAVGDEVWYVDPTGGGASSGGGFLRRIDTSTNTVAASVPLPVAGVPDGLLRATATALFYISSGKGLFRIRPGEATLTPIGRPDTNRHSYPAGDGLWAVEGDHYVLYTSADGPEGTLDLNDADGGNLVGADAESVFLERSTGVGGGHALWRRYLDGRLPQRLAALAPTVDSGIGPVSVGYDEGGVRPTLLVGETSVAKLWVEVSRTDPAESLLLVQGARLPTP